MADSIHKQVIDAFEAVLKAINGEVTVEKNTPVPEEVPEDGLIIVRDAIPGPTQETLGGFDTVYVTAIVPVEVYATHGETWQRDIKYDELLQAVSAAVLKRDANGQRSLGGLLYGIIAERPDPVSEDILGGAPIKAATLKFHIEYEAPTPLS